LALLTVYLIPRKERLLCILSIFR